MERHPVFRITEDDIDELRHHTRDEDVIAAYASWVNRGPKIDSLIRQIEIAFAEIRLGDGTGLLEANGLDNYAPKKELIDLRSRDEHDDWRRIDTETLNQCYAAPTFMNARGFVFHLPAFLIAELNDNFGFGFIDRLFQSNRLPDNWIRLLTDLQGDAITAVLTMIAEHPDYCDHADEISVAIERLKNRAP